MKKGGSASFFSLLFRIVSLLAAWRQAYMKLSLSLDYGGPAGAAAAGQLSPATRFRLVLPFAGGRQSIRIGILYLLRIALRERYAPAAEKTTCPPRRS